MSIELYLEKECFNVYWKVKNFTFCWEKQIKSPEFTCFGCSCYLILDPKEMKCSPFILNPDLQYRLEKFLISFLPCDGTAPLNSDKGEALQVSYDIILGTRRSAFLPKDTLTIWFRYPTTSERGKLFVTSRIGVKRHSFLWTLKNFPHKAPQKIYTDESACYGNIELECKLTGGINSDEQFVIEISRSGGQKCYFVFKVSVLAADGKAVNEVNDEFFFRDEVHYSRELRIIKKGILLTCKNALLPNDTLSLKCDFAVSLGIVTEQTSFISYCADVASSLKEPDLSTYFKKESDPVSVKDLQKDFLHLLEDGTLSDAAVKVESEVFQAHKNILCARSPVFKAMFTQDTKEAIDNVVIIKDLDVETVYRLLTYIYSNIITDYQWESIYNLYIAADKYEILSLKKKCVFLMKASLSISNVCEALLLADMHEDSELKIAVFDFFSKYGIPSEVWKEFEEKNPSLANQTLREICVSL